MYKRIDVACELLSLLDHLVVLGFLYRHSGFWQKTTFLAYFEHVAWLNKRKVG